MEGYAKRPTDMSDHCLAHAKQRGVGHLEDRAWMKPPFVASAKTGSLA